MGPFRGRDDSPIFSLIFLKNIWNKKSLDDCPYVLGMEQGCTHVENILFISF